MIWDELPDDTPEVKAIRRRIKQAWERNDREHGFEYNGLGPGLIEAIRVLQGEK